MKRSKHLEIDRVLFGEEFPEVHKWLDATYIRGESYKHWINRHHLDAISEKYDAEEDMLRLMSAFIHVMCDFWSRGAPIIKPPAGEIELITLLVTFGMIEIQTKKRRRAR